MYSQMLATRIHEHTQLLQQQPSFNNTLQNIQNTRKTMLFSDFTRSNPKQPNVNKYRLRVPSYLHVAKQQKTRILKNASFKHKNPLDLLSETIGVIEVV